MDCRGVMSAEMIFVTLLVILVIISLIPLINNRMDAASRTDELGNARMLAENVAEAINKVYAGGNGHSIYLHMPANINGKDFTVVVNSTGSYVKIDGMAGKSFTVPYKVSGSKSLKNDEIVLFNGHSYIITNVEDSNGYKWIVITST